ncbi:MAG: hypothetical protein ACM3U2_18445 [Deltaproteobacteria bacterium]
MLRITHSEQNAWDRTVKLEGKLLRPWVDEVRSLFIAGESGTLPRLDLSCLRFADRDGTELLRQLLAQGVRITSCSPFVAELLHWDGELNP